MRTKSFGLVCFVLTFTLGIAQQTIKVTPQSLAGWTLTGADLQTLANQPALALPAAAQLASSFPNGDLQVAFKTQPLFGTKPEDWPVLEVGSVALVFSSDGKLGKLSVVMGEGAPRDLLTAIALDADGRSAEPLSVIFARKDGQITVAAAGQSFSLSAEPTVGPVMPVVLSAGAGHDWSFEQLEISLPAAVATNEANGSAASQPTDATGAALKFLDPKTGATKPRPPRAPGVTTEPESVDRAAMAKAAASVGAASLEVFTPSALHHGRADTVRAAVAGQKQN